MGDAPHPDPRVDLALARSYILDTRDTPLTAGATAALLWLWFAWLTQQWGVLVWALLVHGMQIHMHRYLHAVDPEAIAVGDAAAWRRRLEGRMLFPGLIWALGPWLLLPPPHGDLTQLLVMYFCFGGFASVVISLLTQWWLAALCFGVPVMLSLAARLALSPLGSIGWIMAALVLWQLLTTLHYARKQNRLIVSALETNLENARLAEALRAQLERVAELAAQRARVFAAANHDLRQPLHALAIFVDALRPGEPPRPASIGHMRDSVDALRISIDALLDIAQMDQGAEQAVMKALPLAPLFAAVRGRFESAAVAKDLRLRIRLTPAAVWADERLLARLLGNLVDNAIKYTARGTVLVVARPALTDDGAPAWRIEVRDSGQGVAPAHAARVFEEFFQVDNPGRNRARGLGLGLALVASMARALGSAIRLRSRLGEGSTFSLVLRQAPPPVPAGPQAAARPEPRRALPALRVLVLDDEAPVRDAMQTLLGGWGHAVATAASPGEALQQGGVFDLLLCDLRLAHGLSGLTAANTLLGIGKVRRVIVLTGETGHEDCQRVEAAGHALLFKPASAERLQATMSEVMAGPVG